MFQVLVIENDIHTRNYLKKLLSTKEFYCHIAEDVKMAEELLDEMVYDLIIADTILPETDGITFVNRLRERKMNLPIMMITYKPKQKEINQALKAGADDIMGMPIDEEEFLLRIQALLRRAGKNQKHLLHIGNTILNYKMHTVQTADKEDKLPGKEFELLYMLLAYPNRVFTREQLMDEIWGPSSETDSITVCVHINRLRKRYKDNPDFTILTLRGIG